MLIIPAIDLLNGRAVRLLQGKYETATDFGDPVDWLLRWKDLGAEMVHVVDLEGARNGKLSRLDEIRTLAAHGVPIQAGGGIRSLADVEGLFSAGVARVVIGTQAVGRPDFVREAVERHGDRIVVAIDARNGRVMTRGWQSTTETVASELAEHLAEIGVRRFAVTDVRRDGTLTEPNYALLRAVLSSTARPVIASGGVTTKESVVRLRSLGVEASIVGRALYDGVLQFEDAVRAAHAG